MQWAAEGGQGFLEDLGAVLGPASTEDILRDGPGQFFVLAAEVARGQFDPVVQWDEFVHALWEQVDAGFGISPDNERHLGIPRAWFEEPDDPAVVVWEEGPESG